MFMLIYCLMNTLNFSHPTLVATQTFDTISKAMGGRDYFDLDNTIVHKTSGRVACLTIESPLGSIDLSQDPSGELVDGIIRPLIDLPHDDERDFTLGSPRPFPQTEKDISFIAEVVRSIKEASE